MPNTGIELPEDLFPRVMKSIYAERQRLTACRRFVMASVVCMTALVAIFPIWDSFRAEFTASGFGQFLSLLVWDTGSVFVNWQDYILSLLESFPMLNAAVLLAIVLSILVSLKFISKYMSSLRRLKPSHNSI